MDPGEDFGWALWDEDTLVEAGTDKGWEFVRILDVALGGPDPISRWQVAQLDSTDTSPDLFTDVERFVIEEFILYPEGVGDGPPAPWDQLRTSQFIGALRLLAEQHGVAVVFQPAQIKAAAKTAGADTLFLSPRHENRHANDAIMHGWHYATLSAAGMAPEAEGLER